MNAWFYSLVSVFLVSLASLVGVFTLSLQKKVLGKITFLLVSFAAGALLGDAFLHLIPHALEEQNPFLPFFVLFGFLLFFVLEKFLKWRHCHDQECPQHSRELGIMNLVADGLHNFIDGVIIAASFLTSFPVGLATSLAVFFHEVPQEIGDFGVLIHSGYSSKKALVFNFISALTALLGAIVVLLINPIEGVTHFLLSLTAGGFVYIAASGLIPQLHKEQKLTRSLLQFFGLLLGMGTMAVLLFLE